jgi:hypothetical protein
MVKEGLIVVPAVTVGVPVAGDTATHPVAESGVDALDGAYQM